MTTKFKEGYILRNLRLKSELSISDLASEIGVDPLVITDFESDCKEHSNIADIVKVQEWLVLANATTEEPVLEQLKMDPTLEKLAWLSDSNPKIYEKFKSAIDRVVEVMGAGKSLNSLELDIAVTQLQPRTWNF